MAARIATSTPRSPLHVHNGARAANERCVSCCVAVHSRGVAVQYDACRPHARGHTITWTEVWPIQPQPAIHLPLIPRRARLKRSVQSGSVLTPCSTARHNRRTTRRISDPRSEPASPQCRKISKPFLISTCRLHHIRPRSTSAHVVLAFSFTHLQRPRRASSSAFTHSTSRRPHQSFTKFKTLKPRGKPRSLVPHMWTHAILSHGAAWV